MFGGKPFGQAVIAHERSVFMSKLFAWLLFAAGAFACSRAIGDRGRESPSTKASWVSLQSDALQNRTPYIPAQCYTKTRGVGGRVHNPCFVCHQDSIPPNYIDDSDLQLSYSFPSAAANNPWTNLFVDRREAVRAISDDEILSYVRISNYVAHDGTNLIANKIAASPTSWDVNGNGRWDGWIPDIGFDFDDEGFDRLPQGEETGWRALAYHPFPGTFFPTNGSFGDVLIRLPEAFRKNEEGLDDRVVHRTNLAILEAVMTRRDVPIRLTDERLLGVDLDGDGKLGEAAFVRYSWAPGEMRMRYVGQAKRLQETGDTRLHPGLFPSGTELAHSVRYLDIDEAGKPKMAARMKELRYMVKKGWLPPGQLEMAALREAREKDLNPNQLRKFGGDAESGIGNSSGWRLQGFIEDAEGDLRPQSREEHAACIGCHSGVGATTDSVFSFSRKLPGENGWFHWSQRGLSGVGERIREDGRGEYTVYLEENGAGDEFRSNDEVMRRFFSEDGRLDPGTQEVLARDVEALLLPSRERALVLDKAYRIIAREQSFARGRDATVAPLANVHRELPSGPEPEPTGIAEAVRP